MMASRCIAIPTYPFKYCPRSSGPRWRMASHIRDSRSASTGSAWRETMPTIPHMLCLSDGEPPQPHRLFFQQVLLSSILGPLFQQHEPDGDKNKIEDQKLCALAKGRADVPLKDGIGQSEHHRKD